MRLSLLLLPLLFVSLKLFSQHPYDNQWLISNGKGKSGFLNDLNCNVFENPITTDPIVINNTPRPSLIPIIPSGIDPNNIKDQLLVIYDDGGSTIIDITTPNEYSYTGFSIQNPSAENILLMYLTSIYHDDDPPENIQVGSNVNTSAPIDIQLSGPQNHNNLLVNNDIIHGKDITLIVNHSENQYIRVSHPSSLALSPQNFGVNTNYNSLHWENSSTNPSNASIHSSNVTPIQNENSAISLPSTPGTTVLNFRCLLSSDQHIGYSVTFTLEDRDNTSEGISTSVDISSKFHDPNFVEVQCVWEECGNYYARYHVECFNDEKNGSVQNVNFNIILPDIYVQETFNAQEWIVGCHSGCGSLITTTSVVDNENIVKIDYPNTTSKPRRDERKCSFYSSDLSNYNELTGTNYECCYEAWIEFCIQLDVTDINEISSNDLRLKAWTTFKSQNDSMDYAIHPFIDPFFKEDRISNTNCRDCSCKNCWFLDWFKCLFK